MEHLSKQVISWASILDENTREQAIMTGTMPFIYPHIAIMPDAHLGKGATVGSVIPTRGAIIPAAVGVDIGCGMIAVRTQFTADDIAGLDRSTLRTAIEKAIPLSAGKYNMDLSPSAAARTNTLDADARLAGFDPASYVGNWKLHLGTLGSGNHFIEVSLDQDDRVWLFLHSGSRGIGNRIAQHHIKVAQEQCASRFIELPHTDLAYLVEGEAEFDRYIAELRWAQEFAFQNRAEMMDRVRYCFEKWAGALIETELVVNCHHNYTEQENHFGSNVWLSRKGAIDAAEGVWGLIPGSMGDRSYVVKGKGNKVALCSAPHGAGRQYSRSAARKRFTQDELRAAMGDIEYRDTPEFIDEIPAAYKPIDVVMQDADPLVEVVYELRQIVNVKGD
ncbi:RtcB family protein [Leucobacter viscericola]|uniref:3'-phosphate/5'-hydroxy nucleic acid ligase n=1 Tax=Leucobacter viscericola TaxID=2714935 RepID=A0A6G7XGT2_9MICO|nr:RtcB family protein [Leucobacter viscericola]QIK63814.1 RtcB family protein [Leucobacter viscericola]